MSYRTGRRLLLLAILPLLVFAAGARCHPPETRAIVFIQGLYTRYDADGTQGTSLEEHRFDTLKAEFLANGYEQSDLLDFSYAGGAVDSNGDWRPRPYGCALTDRYADVTLVRLEQMLVAYKHANPEAHFALVGHSLGGYLAFLEGAREAERPDDAKLDIHTVVTLDAPLKGASGDKQVILDQVECPKTYQAGGELVLQKADAAIPDTRTTQALAMGEQGIRLATFGNNNDCLWRTARCIGGTWVDDGDTQYVPGAALTASYDVVSGPLESHDAILAHQPAVAEAAAFVGAP